MENCCQSIIKYLIFILNFVIAVAGLALVGVGAYVYTQTEDNSLISLIVIGIITFIIAFFGCCGSVTENKCMIYTYATILFVISLIQIFIAIYIYDYIPGLPQRMKSDMDNYGKNETFTTEWMFMQKTLSCCGIMNYEDWNINSTAPVWNINSTALDSHLNDINYDDFNTNKTAPGPQLNVPESCCYIPPCTATNVYPVGCFEKLATVMTMAATVTIGIALLQMIIGICSCWIGHGSRMGEDTRRLMQQSYETSRT